MPRHSRHAAVIFAPLSIWPATHQRTPASDRTAAQFRAELRNTYGLLALELARIGVRSGKVELDIDPRQLKGNGGMPYAGYSPKDPGVVLRFVRDGAEIVMPCDKFETWADNLRGIALTLFNLRALDRYGATASGQQYRGFTALPAVTTPTMNTETAARCVLKRSKKGETDTNVGKLLANPIYARDVVRLAMHNTHPEKGGNDADFALVNEAKRILQAHHGFDL
jgi:hypothetical protein